MKSRRGWWYAKTSVPTVLFKNFFSHPLLHTHWSLVLSLISWHPCDVQIYGVFTTIPFTPQDHLSHRIFASNLFSPLSYPILANELIYMFILCICLCLDYMLKERSLEQLISTALTTLKSYLDFIVAFHSIFSSFKFPPRYPLLFTVL